MFNTVNTFRAASWCNKYTPGVTKRRQSCFFWMISLEVSDLYLVDCINRRAAAEATSVLDALYFLDVVERSNLHNVSAYKPTLFHRWPSRAKPQVRVRWQPSIRCTSRILGIPITIGSGATELFRHEGKSKYVLIGIRVELLPSWMAAFGFGRLALCNTAVN